jgi:hypothetical protein
LEGKGFFTLEKYLNVSDDIEIGGGKKVPLLLIKRKSISFGRTTQTIQTPAHWLS